MKTEPLDEGDLCRLIYDIMGRGGVDDAMEYCREFMEEDCPELLELLDLAVERGRELT